MSILGAKEYHGSHKKGKQGVKFSCFLEVVEEARRSECSCINQMSVLTFTAVFPSLLVNHETVLNHFPVSHFGHANLEHIRFRQLTLLEFDRGIRKKSRMWFFRLVLLICLLQETKHSTTSLNLIIFLSLLLECNCNSMLSKLQAYRLQNKG